jgi:hypothetical protein
MALVNLKSTAITNRDATPKVLTDAYISGGQVDQAYGWVFTGSADNAGSQYRLCQVPSDVRLSALDMSNTALGSGCILDIAVWYPTYVPSGGGAFLAQSLASTLISSSAFNTGIVGNTAQATYTNQIVATNTFNGVNYQEMPLWQMVGLASDPEIPLDIGISVRIATATAGYIGLKSTFSF